MNKTLLKQALKFKDNNPTYSTIEKLYKEAQAYQPYNDENFIYAKYRQKSEILDEALFFEFLSEVAISNGKIKSYEDIENLLNATSRKENIEATGNSKNSIVRVFDNVVVHQYKNNNPVLYKDCSSTPVEGKILAVENGETFLNIYNLMSAYGFDCFVYLGGFSNSATREYLQDKDVVFFLDYDIEAIRIYDSFNCKSKEFFRHHDIELHFEHNSNSELYLKQRANLPKEHKELQWLIELIKKYSAVVEQEVY